MLLKSDTVHNAWAATQRTVGVKLTIKGTEYDASDITSLTFDSGAMNGEALTLGSTYQNTIKVVFSRLIEGLALTDEITPELGIKLADGTWDYTPLGVFVIDAEVQQDRNNNTTTISASDRMCMMGGTYKSKLTYPAAINDIAVEVANLAAVKLNDDDFARLPTDKVANFGSVTYRDAIGYVAQFAGGFATFDRDGLLDIRQLADPNFEVTPSQYQSKGLTKNEALYRIGGIACTVTTTTKDDSGNETQDTKTLQSGSSAGTQITISNPGMTQDLLDGLYEQLQDLNFYPFSLSWFGDPNLEAGDWIEVQDTAGNTFKTPNLLYSLTFSGGVTATSKADTTVSASASFVYKGQLNQIVENIRQYLNASGQQVSEGLDEPLHPKAGDVWFKKSGPDTYIMMYKIDPETGIGSWVEEVSTKGVSGLDAELKAAKAKLNAEILAAQANLATAQKDVAALQTKLATNDQTQAQLTKDLAANAQLVTQNKADVDAALVTVNKTLSQAQTDTATAVKNADLAVTNAQSAVDASGLATKTANAASDAALAAKNLATSTAKDFATVQSQAATAASDAATALSQAKSALATANGVSGDYKSIKQIVDDTAGTIKTLATSASVDAVSGRVTKAQSLAEQTADGLTFKADNSVVNTLSDTVKQQGIDLKAAQGQLALKITQNDLAKGLDGYATETWASQKITATAQGWETQLNSVQAQYNDIGQSQGRNYIRNSRFDSGMDFWGSSGAPLTFNVTTDSVAYRGQQGLHMYGTTTTAYQGIAKTINVRLAKGQKFVIGLLESFDGPFTQGTLNIGIHFRDKDKNILGQQWITFFQKVGWNKSYNRQSQVYEAPVDCDNLFLMIYAPGVGTAVNVYITEVSLTVGPTSFGWQAAPEDTATYTDTKVANLKLTVDGLTATFASKGDLETVSTTAKTAADGYKTLTTKVNSQGTQISTLQTGVNGFNSTVSRINTRIDGISVGGANLLSNTKNYSNWYKPSTTTMNIENSTSGMRTNVLHYWGTGKPLENQFLAVDKVHLVAGQSYTFSCQMKYYSSTPSGASVTQHVGLYSDYTTDILSGHALDITAKLTDTFAKYSVTFVAQKTGDFAGWRVLSYDSAYYSGSLYVAELQLESGTIATDYSPSVSDLATAAQYTSIQQTVAGVQITANAAATKASLTLLSNQLTSVIDAGDNRVRKQWFDDGSVGGWPGTVYSSGSEGITGHKNYVSLKGRDNLEVGNSFSVSAGETYYIDAWLNTWSSKYPVSIGLQVLLRDGSTKWFSAATIAINQGPSRVSGSVTMPDLSKSAIPWVQISGPSGTDLGTALMLGMRVTQNAGSSQITQLKNDINLRVTKGDISNQINITTQGVLIDGNKIHITGATSIDTAAIKSAAIAGLAAEKITSGSISSDRLATTKLNADNITSGSIAAARIASTALSATNITSGTLDVGKLTVKNLSADLIASGTIDASKITVKNLSASNIIAGTFDGSKMTVKNINASAITTGTLNAANLNVVGLNASAITTGTISGANLAINLNTGEVTFTKGSIKSIDGHLNIDVNDGTFAQSDGTKGMLFADGNLYLSSASWWNQVSGVPYTKPDYGFIGYTDTLLTARGFGVIGRDALTIGLTDNENPGMEYTSSPVITMGRSNVTLNFTGELATIQAGQGFTINTNPYYNLGRTPGIQIGSNVGRSGIGDRVFIDGSYVYIPSAYSRTSSGSANLIVSADGAIVRTSSATKYKSNIERFRSTDMGETLLSLPQAHWYNKQDMQRYADDPQHYSMPELDYGMIAEDLAAAGLEDLVVRGDDGELEDIRYDRIAPALLPLLAKMKQEIEELKGEKSE